MTDRKGVLAAFDRCADNLKQVSSVLVDSGYSGKPFAEAVRDKLRATVQIAKRNELHTFAVMPQRWVVERYFAWLEKCRRLWKKLRTILQHQPANDSSRLPRPPTQKIVNRFLGLLRVTIMLVAQRHPLDRDQLRYASLAHPVDLLRPLRQLAPRTRPYGFLRRSPKIHDGLGSGPLSAASASRSPRAAAASPAVRLAPCPRTSYSTDKTSAG